MISEVINLIYSNLFLIVSTLTVVYLLKWIIDEYESGKKYPKGPMGLPIVGSLPFLGTNAHQKLVDMTSKYGNVFTVKLGSKRVVVVNRWKAIKEVLMSDNFLARPHDNLFKAFFGVKSKHF